MSVSIECRVPTSEFLLGEFFARYTEVTATLERVVPLGQDPVPYLWITGDQSVANALESESGVQSVTVVDDTDEGTLVKVEWRSTPDSVIDLIAEADGTLLRGHAADGYWELHLRFPDRARLESFDEVCRDVGVDLSVESIQDGENGVESVTDGLTPAQAETLRVAVDRGYFQVPRETTLADLASEFGISDTAVSQRLRRALGTVVCSSLDGEEP